MNYIFVLKVFIQRAETFGVCFRCETHIIAKVCPPFTYRIFYPLYLRINVDLYVKSALQAGNYHVDGRRTVWRWRKQPY